MTPTLLLAGLGHAHLFVLEAIEQGRLPPCRVIVCTAERSHVYSGMVPGWLGGRYALDELSIDVAARCAASGVELEPHHVVAIDADAKHVRLDDGRLVAFDVCSLAVGSVPAGLDIPGSREHAWPLKPLQNVEAIARAIDLLATRGSGHVTVVGGGLAGIEMALAARARLDRVGATARAFGIHIVSREATLFSGRGRRFAAKLERACDRQQVQVHTGAPVQRVTPTHVHLTGDRVLPSDVTIWATGPAAATWLSQGGLAVEARGFVLVNDHLQSVSAPHVFAAGDCATLASAPTTDKAGVYAVRMGPHLARALAQALSSERVRETYSPQRHWLTLVNTGDGRAIASWGPLFAEGAWAMRLKDRIDRAFMDRFSASARRHRDDASQ